MPSAAGDPGAGSGVVPELGAGLGSGLIPGSEPDRSSIPEGDGQIRSGKLAGRTMWSAILVLALPVLVQQTAQAFVGMADKLFAGQLAPDVRVPALDAVGIGSYVGWFIGIAMAGLGADPGVGARPFFHPRR